MDWYVENTTVIPPVSYCRMSRNCFKIAFVSVEAGSIRSVMLSPPVSEKVAPPLRLALVSLALASEHIQMEFIGFSDCADHSRNVCPNRAMEGTKNRISPRPCVSCSAILSDVKVLPVPQAIISLPRPDFLKYACVAVKASSWCSRSCFLGSHASCPDIPSANLFHSTVALYRLDKYMRWTCGCCWRMVSSALLLHRSVVAIHNLAANCAVSETSSEKVLLDVERKLSTDALSM